MLISQGWTNMNLHILPLWALTELRLLHCDLVVKFPFLGNSLCSWKLGNGERRNKAKSQSWIYYEPP